MKFEDFNKRCVTFDSQVTELFEKKPNTLKNMLDLSKNVVENFVDVVRHFEGRKGEVSAEKRQEFEDFCQAMIDRMEGSMIDWDEHVNRGVSLAENIKWHKKSIESLEVLEMSLEILEMGPEMDIPHDIEVKLLYHIEVCGRSMNEYMLIWDRMKKKCEEVGALREKLENVFIQNLQKVYGLVI